MQNRYSGVTVTDQVNCKIKRESDGLGRLIKVTEQNVSSGTLNQETSYTYNLLDKLTGVNQGKQPATKNGSMLLNLANNYQASAGQSRTDSRADNSS